MTTRAAGVDPERRVLKCRRDCLGEINSPASSNASVANPIEDVRPLRISCPWRKSSSLARPRPSSISVDDSTDASELLPEPVSPQNTTRTSLIPPTGSSGRLVTTYKSHTFEQASHVAKQACERVGMVAKLCLLNKSLRVTTCRSPTFERASQGKGVSVWACMEAKLCLLT